MVVNDANMRTSVQNHELISVLQIEDRKSIIDPKGPIGALNQDKGVAGH